MPDAGDNLALLEPPARMELPLFDYGLLKPDGLAYDHLLAELSPQVQPARLDSGALRNRDGLPLLDPEGEGGVEGVLLSFSSDQQRQAYSAVCGFAPRQHYRWLSVSVSLDGGGAVIANALLGRHPDRGSADEWFHSWSAPAEPVFRFGMHAVRQLGLQHAAGSFPALGDDNPALWERFYGLHSAHGLLWSAVERFSALAFGPAEPALNRLYRLGDEARFRESVISAGVTPSRKTPDSRDPQRSRRVRADGSGAMYSWEAVRSSVGHVGATAFHEGIVVRRALVELHDTFRLLLLSRLPEVAHTWTELDPAGAEHRWLLRPVVSPDGLS